MVFCLIMFSRLALNPLYIPEDAGLAILLPQILSGLEQSSLAGIIFLNSENYMSFL